MATNSNTPEQERDQWRTPPEVFKWLNRRFLFDFDAACSERNALAGPLVNFMELPSWAAQDALAKPWMGDTPKTSYPGYTTYCNPPYSNIAPWVERAIEAAEHGMTVVMLMPSPNGERHHARALAAATELILINGRLAFLRPDGTPVAGNTRGSCVYVFERYNLHRGCQLRMVDRDAIMDEFGVSA